jgi:hypothetical protein
MKKIALALILVTLASLAFAIDFSAGLGETAGYGASTLTVSSASGSGTSIASGVPLGVVAFFDATYAQASVGWQMVLGSHLNSTQTILGSTNTTDTDLTMTIGNLTLALYGRYPFTLGSITISPLLGVEYDINLIETVSGIDQRAGMTGDQLANLNELWIKAGVSADFRLSSRFYVRPALLFGYKFLSRSQSDTISSAPSGTTVRILNLAAELSVLFGYRI